MSKKLRIVSYNINSLRIRLGVVEELRRKYDPDLILLQETKVADEAFPIGEIEAIGFGGIYYAGQKSYHGVAILSKERCELLGREHFGFEEDKRHMGVRLGSGEEVHNFYVPAGGDIPDAEINKKFRDKLIFFREMIRYIEGLNYSGKRIIVGGDLNIAPLEHDVWSHKALLKEVSHSPEEIELFKELERRGGLLDIGRKFTASSEKLYSWWSYRNRDFRKSNRGRRLDHLMCNKLMEERIESFTILDEYRERVNCSDHVPIMTDFVR